MNKVVSGSDCELHEFLVAAMGIWNGPGASSDRFAVSLGFNGLNAFHSRRRCLMEALDLGEGLGEEDFALAVRLASIAVSDDYYGAASEWSNVTRFSTEDATSLLAILQTMTSLPAYELHGNDGCVGERSA
ncbi:hypothetical protein [Paenarthrobacter sp. NPDC090522]|uniref:hypothetical protein n=1 Tax=Paenarthrobacter sp. NPDC090522 TaxID=3364383 RepID=UPI003819E7D8